MSAGIKRAQFMFWLDFTKETEQELAQICLDLKRSRQFAKTVRDGIRLIVDLRKGNTTVLLELFPQLKSRLYSDDLPNQLSQVLEALQSKSISLSDPVMQKVPAPIDLKKPILEELGDLDLTVTASQPQNSKERAESFMDALFSL